MAAFFTQQLDFILFFYGLAFLLLGVVSLAIARGSQASASWTALGLFGLVHGTAEWMDLLALIFGGNLPFDIVRTAVMTASFVFLMEAARLQATERWVTGRWIYAPLLLLVLFAGQAGGVVDANAMARYAVGLPGAMGMALVLMRYARTFSGGERRMAIAAAVGFALYGIAAGAIVPPATFWPATLFNYDAFSRVFGFPIQLVRGLLACWIAFSIRGIWGQKVLRDVSSARYTNYLKRQFVWTLIAMVMILSGGWVLTEYLGGFYRQNVREESQSNLDLLSGRFIAETANVNGIAKSLSESSALQGLFADAYPDVQLANLRLNVEASGAKLGYLLNRSGTVIASTDLADLGRNDSGSSYFKAALDGKPGHSFGFDPVDGTTLYNASYPAFGPDGKLVGIAVLEKSLAKLESDLRQFDRRLFLIDPNGVVVLTNNPAMLLTTLWPLTPEMQTILSRQFGQLKIHPIFKREIADATWIAAEDESDYARRRYLDESGWSLIVLTTPKGIVASRVLGIIITLLAAAGTLVYLVVRERWVYDTVQMEKRLELEDLARNLDLQASTDSLTGAFNRLKFDQELSVQISRARRYGTALSLVLYDVDHFKSVNDSFGHQVGDKVLRDLARLTAQNIRASDLHARWGGEEFAIVACESTASMAQLLAENLRGLIEDAVFEEAGKMSCSFGVAQFEPGDSAESFIARADSALYRAKGNGRNRVEVARQIHGVALGEVA